MHKFSLSDLALQRPITVAMSLVALLLLGVIALFRVPLAFLPETAQSSARVAIDVTRASPELLEREIIRPLEEAIAGVRDLESVRVSSGPWGVRANVNFRAGTNLDARKIELRERVDRARAKMSDLVQRVEVTPSWGMGESPVLQVQISSDRPLTNDYYLLTQRVVRPLERIAGVARVELEGVESHELDVQLDIDHAQARGVELSTIVSYIRQSRSSKSLGHTFRTNERLNLRSTAVTADPESLEALEVPVRNGAAATTTAIATPTDLATTPTTVSAPTVASLPLREIATVELHPQEMRRGSHLNGRPAISLNVYAAAEASAVEVSGKIREVLEEIRNDPALGNLELLVEQDQGAMLLNSLRDLRNTGLFGALVACLVLFGFLHRIRPTLAAALSIPASIIIVCGTIFLRGGAIDSIVLLGMVLGVGMLIDNAVVMVEAIQTKLLAGYPPSAAARLGAREVGLPTMASTLSTIIVFLPLMFGDPGDQMLTYTRALGLTFVAALCASLFVSQAAIPLALGRFLKLSPKPTRHPIIARLRHIYGKLLDWTLRHPIKSVLFGLLLVALAIWPARDLRPSLGEMEEQSVSLPISLEISGPSDFSRVERYVEKVEQVLLSQKEALNIASISCFYRDGSGRCEVFPSTPMNSREDESANQQRIRQALPELPAVRYRVGERGGWRGQNRDPRAVTFVIRGEDMGILMDLTQQASKLLEEELPRANFADAQSNGLDRVVGPFNEGQLEMHVVLDRERILATGLNASQIASAIGASFQGTNLGIANGPQGEVTLIITQHGGATNIAEDPTLDDLQAFRIPLGQGKDVPLTAIARLEPAFSPHWVQRFNRQTEIRTTAFFRQGDAAANREAVQKVLAKLRLPAGYATGEPTPWRGEKDGRMQMIINLGLALMLVYAVMASLFESYIQPLAILIVALLGCMGAPLALAVSGTELDAVSMIGFFMLIGIVVNNGIMLVDRTTALRQQGYDRDHALREGAGDRLRPILMTVGTSIVGLLPMLIHHPSVAGIYYHGIAIVLAGGLLTSTAFTLLFLPATYVIFEDTATAIRRAWRSAAV